MKIEFDKEKDTLTINMSNINFARVITIGKLPKESEYIPKTLYFVSKTDEYEILEFKFNKIYIDFGFVEKIEKDEPVYINTNNAICIIEDIYKRMYRELSIDDNYICYNEGKSIIKEIGDRSIIVANCGDHILITLTKKEFLLYKI